MTNTRRALCAGLATLVIAPMAGSAIRSDTSFSRVYKLGDKATYRLTHTFKDGSAGADTVEVDVTATKLLDHGRAELAIHFHDAHFQDGSPLPPDVTVSTGDHNIPASFSPSGPNAQVFLPFFFLAGFTFDAPVKVGDTAHASAWPEAAMGFDATATILQSAADQVKEQLKGKATTQGHPIADITMTITDRAADGSLVTADAELTFGSFVQDLNFTRVDAEPKK